MYVFSSAWIEGNPSGFQRWTQDARAIGISTEMRYDCFNYFVPCIILCSLLSFKNAMPIYI
jgi:hypothetical protein